MKQKLSHSGVKPFDASVMAFQYNLSTSNRFDPLLKRQEKRNMGLCKKLFNAAPVDRTSFDNNTDYNNFIVQLYQEGIMECKEDVRLFSLCDLLVSNLYHKDVDVYSKLIRLTPEFCDNLYWTDWHRWTDLSVEFPFMSYQSEHRTHMTFKYDPFVITVDKYDTCEQIVMRTPSAEQSSSCYEVVRNAKFLKNDCIYLFTCQSLFSTLERCSVSLYEIDELLSRKSTHSNCTELCQTILLSCQRALKECPFDVTINLLCYMLLEKLGEKNCIVAGHHQKRIRELIQELFPLNAEETIFKCKPYTFTVGKDFSNARLVVMLDSEYVCDSSTKYVWFANTARPSPKRFEFESLGKEIFSQASVSNSFYTFGNSKRLFEKATSGYQEDLSLLILCEILATKSYLDKKSVACIDSILKSYLPELDNDVIICMFPFQFSISKQYKVLSAKMWSYGSFPCIKNKIDYCDRGIDIPDIPMSMEEYLEYGMFDADFE